jgi:hypothetical protein
MFPQSPRRAPHPDLRASVTWQWLEPLGHRTFLACLLLQHLCGKLRMTEIHTKSNLSGPIDNTKLSMECCVHALPHSKVCRCSRPRNSAATALAQKKSQTHLGTLHAGHRPAACSGPSREAAISSRPSARWGAALLPVPCTLYPLGHVPCHQAGHTSTLKMEGACARLLDCTVSQPRDQNLGSAVRIARKQTPSQSPAVENRFGGTYWGHVQGGKVSQPTSSHQATGEASTGLGFRPLRWRPYVGARASTHLQ